MTSLKQSSCVARAHTTAGRLGASHRDLRTFRSMLAITISFVLVMFAASGYAQTVAAAQKTSEIKLPVAITVFPEDVYRAPETWSRRAYSNLTTASSPAFVDHIRQT